MKITKGIIASFLNFLIAGIVQAQSITPLDADSANLTLQAIFQQVYQNADPNETQEGGPLRKIKLLESYWYDRAVANPVDPADPNMFQQYFKGLQDDIFARIASQSTCNTDGFHGNWQCIGPDTVAPQAMGYVTCVWADPADSNYILAGTWGGLFKTENGGQSWKCITDNAPIGYTAMVINCIAVNPLNKNTIYLGTASDVGQFAKSLTKPYYSASIPGSAMLKTYDGGQSWEIETLGQSGIFWDSIVMVQKVYFTPDTTRLYAFSSDKLFTRANTPSASWVDITPPIDPVKCMFRDLEFVPGDQDHFLVANGFLADALPEAGIWESTVAVPGTNDWVEITAGFNDELADFYNSTDVRPFDMSDILVIDISIPDADTLYAAFMTNFKKGIYTPFMGLYKYNISGTPRQWTRVNNSLPYNSSPSNPNYGLLNLIVSPAATSNNANRRNIYWGIEVPFHSYDGGLSFRQIGTYGGTPTHADIRGLYLQAATNTIRGIGDRLLVATDGGVSMRYSGTDDSSVNSELSTHNINGRGLTCGHFWSVATSEHGGLAFAGAMHDGLFGYEPMQNQKWVSTNIADAYTCIFDNADRTLAYGLNGFGGFDRDSTRPGSGRLINTSVNVAFPSEVGSSLNPPLAVDRNSIHFAGLLNLWVESNQTSQWSELSLAGLPIDAEIHDITYSPYTDSIVGYLLYGHARELYYRNPNHNNNPFFEEIAGNVPGVEPVTCVTMDPINPERVWVGIGNFNGAGAVPTVNRVYYSPDTGDTWIDVSQGLPQRVVVNEIIFHEGQNTLYCATDVGIYKCDFKTYNPGATSSGYNASVEWECFNDGAPEHPDFPNVYVTELKINHCEGKLYASTYGRSIWSTDLFPNSYVPTPTEVISSNTTWSSTKYINAGVKVTNGATLTIQNTGQDQTVIYMPKNGSIIVEPGAQLVVNGARLTNGCEDCMWNGIRLVGQTNQPQSAANQGKLVLSNGAVIEHAKIGVANYGPDTPTFSNTGGIIEAVDATFLNNARAVSLQPYRHQGGWSPVLKNYLASFAECDFIINNDFKGGTTNRFLSHVDMREVDGVRFSGIGMYNRNTGGSYQGEGDGIRASNSGFRIKAACTSLSLPCTSLRRSRFTGLRTGVWMQYDNERMPYAAYIDRSNFDSCAVGIRSVGYHWFTASRDSFRMGYGKTTFLDPLDCHKNIGIWSEHSYFAHIEGNHFEGFTHGGQHPYHENIGTITDNSFSSAANNWSGNNLQIYRNTFLNLSRACYARGVNSDAGLYYSSNPAGLRYFCNTFDDNTHDIVVKAMSMYGNNVVQSIAYNQGSPNQSAGNQFLDRGSINHLLNVTNGGPSGFSYYHTTGNYVPILHTNWPWNSIALYPTSNAHSCTSTLSAESGGSGLDFPLSSSGLGTIKASFLVAKGNREVLQGTFDALIDGGNTDALLSYISGSTQADSPTVRTTLLGYSPYLTIPVLQAVANANILYQDALMQILEANPEMLRDEALLDHLEYNIPNPLPGAQIDQLRTTSENSSARSDTQSEIADYATTMDWCSMMILNHYLLDTTSDDRDSIPVWLDNINTLRSNYLKAAFYTGMGDYTTAASILEDIPENYELTGDQATEHGLC